MLTRRAKLAGMRVLVAIHHPDDYQPARAEDGSVRADIDALNDAMVAAGVRVFVGGLHPAREARSLRLAGGGEVAVADGPYLGTDEHVGGFWVLDVADWDEALDWGRRAVLACRASVEVRQFH